MLALVEVKALELIAAATLPITDPKHVCNEDCPCHVNHCSPSSNSTVSL
jgi:hypothetical protein